MTPICVDDYGSEVYVCRYLDAPVAAPDAMYVGATIPGVNARYVMGKSEEAKKARKQSAIAFADSERNCNTCKYLKRVPHARNTADFLYGTCTNPNSQKDRSPYVARFEGEVMMFHPDDPMHMPCYSSRWE